MIITKRSKIYHEQAGKKREMGSYLFFEQWYAFGSKIHLGRAYTSRIPAKTSWDTVLADIKMPSKFDSAMVRLTCWDKPRLS